MLFRSLGGHNFWLNNPKWKNLLYETAVIQFKPMYDMNSLEHRGGWKSVLENLENINFFNNVLGIPSL